MSTLGELKKLKPYVKPFIGLIVLSGLLAIPLSALRLSPAPLIKYLVDDLLVNRKTDVLVYFPTLIIAIYILNFVVRFLHYYALRIVIARVNQAIKNDLFDHVMGLSADYFTQQGCGTLMSRVASDPQHIDGGISCINVLIREPITFIFLFGYAIHLNWKLTLLTLFIFPFLAWLFSATGRNLKRYIQKMQEENAKLYSSLQESFSGIRVIKTFLLKKYVRRKFRERVSEFTRFHLKTAKLEEASHPMVELITAFAVAGVVYFGSTQVLESKMTSGDLLAFFTTFAMMMNPIRVLNDVNMKLHQAAGACTRIFEVMSWESHIAEKQNPVKLDSFKNEILLDKVCFSYPDAPDRPILKNVSFSVKKGRAIALVGASGAGKSSLVSLIPRIFDVTSGQIRIDGTDIRDLSLLELRKSVAVVSQDVFLFNDTITENIRCGRFSASFEEVKKAAERAHALEFIEKFSDGFNSVIGDRGQKLSGGERQRVSIARAFLRDAPILILDEATSSLDTASERIVQVAIEDLMQDKTTIIIAHRLSTIRNVDLIMVLKDGEVIESGSHEELIQKNGEYTRYYNLSLS